MELKMLDGESYLDFCSRVILSYKDYGFADINEVVPHLTNVDMKDNNRRCAYFLRNVQQAIEEGYANRFASEGVVEAPKKEDLNSFYKSDEVVEVEDKELLLTKIKRLEKQLQSTKDNLRIARADNVKEYRTDTIWDKFVRDFKYIEPIKIDKPKLSNNESKKIAVLNIADCHFGMKFESLLNTYNKDIAIKRMKTLVAKTISSLSKDYKLIILQLGDNISGNIHISTRIDSDMNVVDSTKVFTEAMLGAIVEFCEYFDEVEYHSIHGNHERVTPSKEESLEKENFTNFSDWYIKLATKDLNNFSFKDNRFYGIAELKVFEKKIVALHGHQVSLGNVSNVAHTVGYIPDQIQIAHFHNLNIKDHGRTRVVVNPSFCGVDSYASGKLLYGKPHQLLEVFYENGDKETKELYL